MNLEDLKAPFPVEKIHWRPGATKKDGSAAIALAYIDVRDLYDRLDDVCGPENWQIRYPFVGCCEIGIRVNDEWIWKANGAGATQIEGEKGQFSDSAKRAGVPWNIGRYLYDVPNVWSPLNQYKRFDKETIADLNKRLAAWQLKLFGD